VTPARRRRRWLDQRHDQGRTRPRPLTVRTVNAMSVSAGRGRAEEIWANALTTPGRYGVPALVLGSEMWKVDAQAVADRVAPGVWQVVQRGKHGSPNAALVIAVRRTRGLLTHAKMLDGTAATSEGGGIRRRPILTARVFIDRTTPAAWSFVAAAVHAPPSRAPRARRRYLAALRTVRAALIAGDMNALQRAVQRALGRRVEGVRVLHFAIRRWIPTSPVTAVEVGGDHKGVDTVLWP
jgi:hypothetical protein